VNQPACETLGFPMSVVVSDLSQTLATNTALSHKINTSLYVANAAKAAVMSGSVADRAAQLTALHDQLLSGPPYAAPVDLDFVYSDGAILARKQFKFRPGYEIQVVVSVSDGQHDLPVGVQWPGGFGDNSLPFKTREVVRQTVHGTVPDLTTLPQSKVTNDKIIYGPLGVAGLEDRFFVNVFLPQTTPLGSPGTPGLRPSGKRRNCRSRSPPRWQRPRPSRSLSGFLWRRKTSTFSAPRILLSTA
jgi:hypothetical protein